MASIIRRLRRSGAILMAVCVLALIPTSAHGQDPPIGEAPEERDADEIFLRGQRVLLGRGDVVLDFGQFYSRSDDLRLAVANGALALATLERTSLTSVVVGRAGIGRETEVFAAASFIRQTDRLFVDTTDLAGDARNERGNSAVGIRHTFLKEGPGRPDIIASFDAQLPGSDNPYAAGGGMVFVKSIDPVVLFSGVNYHRSLRRDRRDGTQLAAANSLDVSLGYALALNDTLAISTVASGAFIRAATNSASQRVDFFSLRVALTSALARGLYIEPSVSFGLSGPGQSFTMGVTVPYSF
jgi:hypothetical protein